MLKTKRGSRTFHQGAITKNPDFFIKIFSGETEEILRKNLDFFNEQYKRLGTGIAQIKAISLLLKEVE